MSGSETLQPGLPLLFYADGYRFPDVYHATRFLAPAPVIALEGIEELVPVVRSLEEGRARKESRATTVVNMNEFGAQALPARGIPGTDFRATLMTRILDAPRFTRASPSSWTSSRSTNRRVTGPT